MSFPLPTSWASTPVPVPTLRISSSNEEGRGGGLPIRYASLTAYVESRFPGTSLFSLSFPMSAIGVIGELALRGCVHKYVCVHQKLALRSSNSETQPSSGLAYNMRSRQPARQPASQTDSQRTPIMAARRARAATADSFAFVSNRDDVVIR